MWKIGERARERGRGKGKMKPTARAKKGRQWNKDQERRNERRVMC